MLSVIGGRGGLARALFFALLPAAAAGGGLAVAVLVSAAGAVSVQPNLLSQAYEKRSLFFIMLLVFSVWAVASNAWSSYPDHSQAPKLVLTLALGAMFASAAIATLEARRLTRAGGLAAFVVLALLLAIEAGLGLPLNRATQPDRAFWQVEGNVGRGATILLALSFAAAGGLLIWAGRWRWALAAGTLLASAALTAQFHHFANAIGFWLGLCAFALGWAAPRLTPLLITGAAAFWMLAAPFVTPLLFANLHLDALPFSWASRVAIWDYVSARIAEQPWIGHGLDASRTVTDLIAVQGQHIIAVPLHPHSAALQIWFETGLVGAGLAAAGLIIGGRSLSKAFAHNRAAAAAACATIAALSFVANISYGIWQEWWLATMFVAAAAMGAIAKPAR